MSTCTANRQQEMDTMDKLLGKRLAAIRHTLFVLSGKGGVGKSTVAVNLAASLSAAGNRVGLLDVDFHGPSIPTLLGLQDAQAVADEDGIHPVAAGALQVMSISFLLDQDDAAVIWRGPRKMGAIKQLLAEVHWGALDVLVVDLPPGTGDEPLSLCQLIGHADGALIVTTPQEVSLSDVRRSITFCRQLNLPVLGVIENMSGFLCPACGEILDIFKSGGGQSMATSMKVPFLGRIPIDPGLVHAGDEGTPYMERYPDTDTAKAFGAIVAPLADLCKRDSLVSTSIPSKGTNTMRIAIPIAEGKLALHFGHCQSFALLDADPESKTIQTRTDAIPPAHAPGVLPQWLGEQKANVIIAGGMGSRAQALFADNGIEVVVGAPADTPETIAQAYLEGSLTTGNNICDH